jgi:hypothetical protein
MYLRRRLAPPEGETPEGAAVIYLIVGLDRHTFARWHQNIHAGDAGTAERIARLRAAREGIALEVAAAIGPYSSVVEDEPVKAATPVLTPVA